MNICVIYNCMRSSRFMETTFGLICICIPCVAYYLLWVWLSVTQSARIEKKHMKKCTC